jgi:hypothetical protein
MSDTPTRPRRIQRRRTKGWRMPAGAVYVGRPTRWGNPYRGERDGWYWTARSDTSSLGTFETQASARHWAAQGFRAWWGERGVSVEEIREHLAGRDLVCWCPLDQACHADVLLEIANSGARAA